MSTPTTTTPPVQRRRDRLKSLLSGRGRAVSPRPPVASTSTSAPPQTSQLFPSSSVTPTVSISGAPPPQQINSPPLPATSSPSSANPALLIAIQNHLNKLPEQDKERFRQASATITDENLVSDIRKLNDQHKSDSLFRRHADKLSKFLGLLDRLLGSVAVAIQADPGIASIPVGGVRLIVDLAKGFSEFFDKLVTLLDHISDLMMPLQEYVKSVHIPVIASALTTVYGDLLDICKQTSDMFLDKEGNKKVFVTWKTLLRLQWEPFEKSFGEIEARMNHHRENLLHAAGATLLSTTEVDRRDREREIQQRLQKQQQRETEHRDQEQVKAREEFLRWLSPHNFEHKQNEIFKTKHQGTGDWLLQTEQFSNWEKAATSQLLWCHGKPGAGKSVLASHVINHLQKNQTVNQTGLCFAYFSFTDPTFHGAAPLTLALLKQLCQQRRSVPDILSKSKQEAREPASVSSAETFVEVARSFQQIFVVIDGLDECPERQRPAILDFIIDASGVASFCTKFFVSSRREGDIHSHFNFLKSPVIVLEAGLITPDIIKFVREEVSRRRTVSELHIQEETLLEEVIHKLIEESNGMFLWVRLQLDQLCRASRKGTDYHVKDALSHLPQDLTEMYERIFDGIAARSLGDREIAMECFRWVLYAKESIYADFLLPALALLGSPSATLQELKSKKLAPAYVSEACGNLLSIDEWSKVELIHFSVDEFLRKVLFKRVGGYWKDLVDRHKADFVLACRCIDLLLLADIDLRSDNFEYAARNFDTHVLGSIDGSADLPPGLRTKIDDQLLRVDDGRLRWLLKWQWVYESQHSEPISSSWLVWTTKLCNIPSLRTIWPNLARPKNALILAVQHGNISVLELLLSEGLDIHETDKKGWTALSYATSHNNQPAIDLLLQRGATTDMSKVGTEVLHLAVTHDNIELARRMLVAGADVNEVEPSDCEVPLMFVESLAMARMLCEEFKADAKINDARGMNALFHLQAHPWDDRKTAIFEYFVKQGADVTATTPIGMNILDHAVQQHRGGEKTQFLLQHYPQLASKREKEWTALHWACKHSSPSVDNVRELICHGVNASTITTTHPPGSWTPWDISIHYSSDWIFQECENEIHGLGGPTTSQTFALAAGDGPSVDAAVAYFNEIDNFKCSLCGIHMVRFPGIERTYRTNCMKWAFRFDCTTCHQEFCLMCNDRIHSRNPDHEYRTTYRVFGRYETPMFICLTNSFQQTVEVAEHKLENFAVQVPHLFDPQRPDWQDWLEEIEMRIKKEESGRLEQEDRVTELEDVDGGAESADN
ncbi:hypothetical protein D6D21_01581 [Aureobasidium pullulans]|uniref:NACHT domain-containing protein n=1 Tax=Aureobasidium pullulans TaxID=5580 RepID=A0AB74J808_AURPU|nr:hypothetical protein D6D21_01581 [Aureobasidium pullulans]